MSRVKSSCAGNHNWWLPPKLTCANNGKNLEKKLSTAIKGKMTHFRAGGKNFRNSENFPRDMS